VARRGTWLVALVVASAAGFALLTAPRTPPPLGRGSQAPDFSLPRLEGGSEVSLASLRGQVVLVNFWATWCKPCEDEMPAMGRLYHQTKDAGFALLAVSIDEGREEVDRFQERLALPFPILLDPEKQVAQRYQTYRFPETFLVDREGVIVERYIGPKDWDSPAYLARVQRLLDGTPTSSALR
jgi:peroxiredoxin